jgi:hypothetical protein
VEKAVENNNMWGEILDQVQYIFALLFSKGLIFLSLVFGVFFNAIGYPKEIFIFILTLIIIDLFTKQGSIVIIHYGKFTIKNYMQAWIDRHLTSREIKNGITVKIILYSPFLYIANTIGTLPQIIYGNLISSVMYTMIALVEISSITENFIDSGHKSLIPFRDFIRSKQKQLFGGKEESK